MPTYSTDSKITGGYTGTDIVAVLRFSEIDVSPAVFGKLNTVSYSTYRDKFPVRSVGYTRAKGYTKGSRTVAGTLVFTLLDYGAINDFAKKLYKGENTSNLSLMPDELPPFSIDINFCNEYGNTTKISLIGAEIAEGNQAMSIKNMQINEQYSFVAQDVIQTDPDALSEGDS